MKKQLIVLSTVVAFALMLRTANIAYACCTDSRPGSECSGQEDVDGSCNTGSNNCEFETSSTTTSSECGTTQIDITSYNECVGASSEVVACHDSASQVYHKSTYYCYCKDDWGPTGSCTLNEVHGCADKELVAGCS